VQNIQRMTQTVTTPRPGNSHSHSAEGLKIFPDDDKTPDPRPEKLHPHTPGQQDPDDYPQSALDNRPRTSTPPTGSPPASFVDNTKNSQLECASSKAAVALQWFVPRARPEKAMWELMLADFTNITLFSGVNNGTFCLDPSLEHYLVAVDPLKEGWYDSSVSIVVEETACEVASATMDDGLSALSLGISLRGCFELVTTITTTVTRTTSTNRTYARTTVTDFFDPHPHTPGPLPAEPPSSQTMEVFQNHWAEVLADGAGNRHRLVVSHQYEGPEGPKKALEGPNDKVPDGPYKASEGPNEGPVLARKMLQTPEPSSTTNSESVNQLSWFQLLVSLLFPQPTTTPSSSSLPPSSVSTNHSSTTTSALTNRSSTTTSALTNHSSSIIARLRCDAGLSCNVCLNAIDPSECPTDALGLRRCDSQYVNFGDLCEGNGECGTDVSLDNCRPSGYYLDVYRKMAGK
jgi:hypothetical protein